MSTLPVDVPGTIVIVQSTMKRGIVLAAAGKWVDVNIDGIICRLNRDELRCASLSDKPTNPKDAIATNKLPSHLVSPIVKAYQAIAHYLGNVKYGAWNYRAAGARASVYRAALDRHMDAWWEGEELDPADGTPHLANALACIGILLDAKHSGKLIDDRPPSLHGELAKVRAEFEALMPKIREQYADRDPHHYTIADTGLTEHASREDDARLIADSNAEAA
jgi:hypothetical protein